MHERKNNVTYYRVGKRIFMVKSVGLGNGTSSAQGKQGNEINIYKA